MNAETKDLVSVLIRFNLGQPLNVAVDAVFGVGAYRALAGPILEDPAVQERIARIREHRQRHRVDLKWSP